MSHGEKAGNYQDRVQRLFERVRTIQSTGEEERLAKTKELERAIGELDKRVTRKKEERTLRQDGYSEKIAQIKLLLDEEVESRTRLENQLAGELEGLERYCVRLGEEARTLRDETDRRLVGKLNGAIELIQLETQRHLAPSNFEANAELDQLLRVEIPQLQKELGNECALRRELEGKILEQFMEQVSELTLLYQEEKKKREVKEEDLLNAIAAVAREVELALKRQRADREKNEENILDLVEKVIERLKRDITA